MGRGRKPSLFFLGLSTAPLPTELRPLRLPFKAPFSVVYNGFMETLLQHAKPVGLGMMKITEEAHNLLFKWKSNFGELKKKETYRLIAK